MRKLTVFAFSFAFAVLLCQYFIRASYVLYFAGGSALLTAILLFIRTEKVKAARIVFTALAFGFLWNCAYGFLFSPARHFDVSQEAFMLRVLDFPQPGERHYKTEVEIIQDGKLDLKANLYVYNQDSTSKPELTPGNIVEVDANAKLYAQEDEPNSARGSNIVLISQSHPIVTGSDTFWLRYLPAKFAGALKEVLAKLYQGEPGAFMKALISGDKSDLYNDAYISSVFSVTGSSHVVAVSGMHLSFLVGLIRALLGKTKKASLVCFPVIFFYMAVTGFTPSVVRAGIMQSMLLVAPLIRRDYDNYTALGTALIILLLNNPASIRTASLQLSFASVFGIFLFAERLTNASLAVLSNFKFPVFERFSRIKLIKHTVYFTVSSFSVSLAAISFTTPIVALTFGSIPLISPFTNLFILWAVSFAFPIGIISALFGLVYLPAAFIPAFAAKCLAKYILFAVKAFGQVPFASIYTRNTLVSVWLAYSYSLLVLLIFAGKGKRKALVFTIPALLTLVAVFIVTGITINSKPFIAAALDVGQGQSIVLTSKGSTVIVDCGGDSRDPGSNAAEYVLSTGQREIEALILTHFHSDHANGALTLLKRLKVNRLIVPHPFDDSELAGEIISYACSTGIEILFVERTEYFTFGEMELSIFPPLGSKDDNELGLTILSDVSGFNTLITGDMDSSTEYRLTEYTQLPEIDLYFAGHHGSKYSSSDRLLNIINPKIAFISVNADNNYGHPAIDTLTRLLLKNTNIYTTSGCGEIKLFLN